MSGSFSSDLPVAEQDTAWAVRRMRRLAVRWRPWLGWTVLSLCALLSLLPAMLLWESQWLRTPRLETSLILVGLLAVLAAWVVLGWRAPARAGPAWLRSLAQLLIFLVSGALIISQLLGGWLPSPLEIWRSAVSGAWPALGGAVTSRLLDWLGRYGLWWIGVQQNAAARDDLVLAGVAAVLIWLLAGVCAWLARCFRRGLLAALPILWPLGTLMLYSPAQRWLFVAGVGLALLLHLALDQNRLVERWQHLRLDYSPMLLLDRALMALAAFGLVVLIAALMPNLYVSELSARYYAWLAPYNDRLEGAAKRLFPGLAGVIPWVGRGVGGGMPTAFLVGGARDLAVKEVMRVRTSEPAPGFDRPPLSHTLRSATFSDYDGRGWSNAAITQYGNFGADEPWMTAAGRSTGRRRVLQSIRLSQPSRVLYAAGEPWSVSVDFSAEQRFPGDLIALRAQAGSYTAASDVPALDEAALNALPGWGPQRPLPPNDAIYLALPGAVTQRTRDLAHTLTAGLTTPYAQAVAIEHYLRQYTYDLAVPPVPDSVRDLADYFLFDLKRGYCDYYATAFVVLARLAGLPTRLATGFAPGSWSEQQGVWVVTEADAHSWPEVLFPDVGWVPFEPTAGRPLLERIGTTNTAALPKDMAAPALPESNAPDPTWLLAGAAVGLLLLGGGAVLAMRWRAAREDPWQGLLRWGRRRGRPLAAGDTPLEYGAALAQHVQQLPRAEPELARSAAREVREMSAAVSALHYAPPARRADLLQRIGAVWTSLRGKLRRL